MLTKEDLEEIEFKLEFLHSIIDNRMYHDYSVESLKQELESIEALCAKIRNHSVDMKE